MVVVDDIIHILKLRGLEEMTKKTEETIVKMSICQR